VIEHQAARAFEEAPFLFMMREIDGATNLESGLPRHGVDHFPAPFAAAAGRLHGIQHHGAVGVKADPVVRKYGVGIARLVGILRHAHRHAFRRERGGKCIELGLRLRRGVHRAT
jgi:hypothetical protein